MHESLRGRIGKASRPAGPTPAGLTGHDVQIYRSDAYLTGVVADFLASGVRAGQPLVVIATEVHRRAFIDALRLRGLDTEELFAGREAVWLDAQETLDAFMEGGMESGTPNRELFGATVGAVFERVLRKRSYLIVRGYGEMVDLLAQRENLPGAVALERLWNELAARYPYSLLCGYSFHSFLHQSGPRGLQQVFEEHTRALAIEAAAAS